MLLNNENNQINYDIPYSKFDRASIEDFGSNNMPHDKKEKKTIVLVCVAVGVVLFGMLLGILFAKFSKEKA